MLPSKLESEILLHILNYCLIMTIGLELDLYSSDHKNGEPT